MIPPLVFVAGWSLPAASLAPLAERLAHRYQLGMPTDALLESLPPRFIGIGHSLGGLWLLQRCAERLAGYVSINSFARFPWPERVLARMRRRLLADPETVIADFQIKMGCPALMVNSLPPSTLATQLDWLADWDVTDAVRTFTIPTLSLAGAQDTILPTAHQSVCHPEAGDALPLTHPDWCAARIVPWLATCL